MNKKRLAQIAPFIAKRDVQFSAVGAFPKVDISMRVEKLSDTRHIMVIIMMVHSLCNGFVTRIPNGI